MLQISPIISSLDYLENLVIIESCSSYVNISPTAQASIPCLSMFIVFTYVQIRHYLFLSGLSSSTLPWSPIPSSSHSFFFFFFGNHHHIHSYHVTLILIIHLIILFISTQTGLAFNNLISVRCFLSDQHKLTTRSNRSFHQCNQQSDQTVFTRD